MPILQGSGGQALSTPERRFPLCTTGNGPAVVSVGCSRLGFMTSTATTAVDVRDLGPGQALAYVTGCRRDADREEGNLLVGVVHWADLRPVTPDQPAATPRCRPPFVVDDGVEGLVEPPLAGPGTPG